MKWLGKRNNFGVFLEIAPISSVMSSEKWRKIAKKFCLPARRD
jgi:hypothetical protein